MHDWIFRAAKQLSGCLFTCRRYRLAQRLGWPGEEGTILRRMGWITVELTIGVLGYLLALVRQDRVRSGLLFGPIQIRWERSLTAHHLLPFRLELLTSVL